MENAKNDKYDCENNQTFPLDKKKFSLTQYFNLSTQKITMISMMLALDIVISVISYFTLSLLPKIGGFLVLELSIFVIIISSQLFNLFYTIFIIEISVWFRMTFEPENAVGLLSLNLLEICFIVCFLVINFIFSIFINKNKEEKNKKSITVILYFFSGTMAAVITMLFSWLINYYFIFDMYAKMMNNKTFSDLKPLIPTTIWFTFVNYFINLLIYISLLDLIIILRKKHNYK